MLFFYAVIADWAILVVSVHCFWFYSGVSVFMSSYLPTAYNHWCCWTLRQAATGQNKNFQASDRKW